MPSNELATTGAPAETAAIEPSEQLAFARLMDDLLRVAESVARAPVKVPPLERA
jgi:hypothetical protein